MKRLILCSMLIVGVLMGGCSVAKDVLKTVDISKKVNAVSESETTLEMLKALKELIEAMEQ